MANNSSQILINPDGYTLPNPSNSITSMWGDKRSAPTASLSLTFVGSGTPDGYAHVEVSNAPELPTWGGPLGSTSPPDVVTVANSTVTITTTGTTHWEITTAARWIRVVYLSSVDSDNLQVHCYYNVPFSSQ